MLGLVPELAHATLTLVLLVERRGGKAFGAGVSTATMRKAEEEKALTFGDASGELGHAVAEAEDGLLRETPGSASDPDPEVLVAVHHDAVVRLDEEICDSAGDVGEETDGVAKEVGGSKDAVQLAEELLAAVGRGEDRVESGCSQ